MCKKKDGNPVIAAEERSPKRVPTYRPLTTINHIDDPSIRSLLNFEVSREIWILEGKNGFEALAQPTDACCHVEIFDISVRQDLGEKYPSC